MPSGHRAPPLPARGLCRTIDGSPPGGGMCVMSRPHSPPSRDDGNLASVVGAAARLAGDVVRLALRPATEGLAAAERVERRARAAASELAGHAVLAAVNAVIASPYTEQAVDRMLESALAERAVGRALSGPLATPPRATSPATRSSSGSPSSCCAPVSQTAWLIASSPAAAPSTSPSGFSRVPSSPRSPRGWSRVPVPSGSSDKSSTARAPTSSSRACLTARASNGSSATRSRAPGWSGW